MSNILSAGSTDPECLYSCAVFLAMLEDGISFDRASPWGLALHQLVLSAWSALPPSLSLSFEEDNN